MNKLTRVLIMAGGTGGHVFPGLAVADALRQQGIEVAWLGTAAGLEARIVPEAGIALHVIAIQGIRGKGIYFLWKTPFNVVKAIFQSMRVIKTFNPAVVIGMGGFVSGPGGVASLLLRRPLIIHEQNAKAGLTNQWLARWARKILTGFPNVFPKAIVIGNPIRHDIEMIPTPESRFNPSQVPMRLLVLGGSLGAVAINEIVPQALALLSPDERPQVMHQTGEKHFEATQKAYQSRQLSVDLKPFIQEMAAAYSWADVVLCRAGALTIAELCGAGLPAILIPYPHAVDDHQTANAEMLVKQGAAYCIQQSALTAQSLAELLKTLSAAPNKRLMMAQAAYQLRRVKVAEKIVNVCQEVCR